VDIERSYVACFVRESSYSAETLSPLSIDTVNEFVDSLNVRVEFLS